MIEFKNANLVQQIATNYYKLIQVAPRFKKIKNRLKKIIKLQQIEIYCNLSQFVAICLSLLQFISICCILINFYLYFSSSFASECNSAKNAAICLNLLQFVSICYNLSHFVPFCCTLILF